MVFWQVQFNISNPQFSDASCSTTSFRTSTFLLDFEQNASTRTATPVHLEESQTTDRNYLLQQKENHYARWEALHNHHCKEIVNGHHPSGNRIWSFPFLDKFHSPPLSSLHSYSTPGNLVSAGLLPLEKGLKKKGKFWEVTGSTQEVHCTDMLSNVASTPLMQPAPPREGEEGERCQLFQRKWNFRRSLASQAWQSDCPSSCLSSQPIW